MWEVLIASIPDECRLEGRVPGLEVQGMKKKLRELV